MSPSFHFSNLKIKSLRVVLRKNMLKLMLSVSKSLSNNYPTSSLIKSLPFYKSVSVRVLEQHVHTLTKSTSNGTESQRPIYLYQHGVTAQKNLSACSCTGTV